MVDEIIVLLDQLDAKLVESIKEIHLSYQYETKRKLLEVRMLVQEAKNKLLDDKP